MTTAPSKVIIVVDPEFGERLLQLPPDTPVWIIDTPINRKAVVLARQERLSDSHLNRVTTFKAQNGATSVEVLIRELDTIDIHYGCHSAPTAYTVLEAIGTPLTETLRAELGKFGFYGFDERSYGFSAIRAEPNK